MQLLLVIIIQSTNVLFFYVCLSQGTVVDVKTKKQCLEVDVLSRQRCEHLQPIVDQIKDADGCVALRVAKGFRPVIVRGKFGKSHV